jgi:hypothetical protein
MSTSQHARPRRVVHVSPNGDGTWRLELEEGGDAVVFPSRDAAVRDAIDRAKAGAFGRVIVHGEDGHARYALTYGREVAS